MSWADQSAPPCNLPASPPISLFIFGRDALRKGGEHRKSQMALASQGASEPSSGGAFDGPFPVLNGEGWRGERGARDGCSAP